MSPTQDTETLLPKSREKYSRSNYKRSGSQIDRSITNGACEIRTESFKSRIR